nr:MAG TPA: hypothetical protein [Caudoviricetes sp.]
MHWTVERLKRAVYRSSFLISTSRGSLYLSDIRSFRSDSGITILKLN